MSDVLKYFISMILSIISSFIVVSIKNNELDPLGSGSVAWGFNSGLITFIICMKLQLDTIYTMMLSVVIPAIVVYLYIEIKFRDF